MRQFKEVFRFEFLNYAKSKPYIIITAVLVVLIAAVLTYPRFSTLLKGSGGEEVQQKLAVSDLAYHNDEMLKGLAAAYPKYQVIATTENMEQLKARVTSGDYAAAVIIETPLKYTYLTVSVSLYDSPKAIMSSLLVAKYQQDTVLALGLSATEAQNLLNPQIEGTVTETGKNQADSFIYTYILIYALYMAILLYGQFVASSVASEKSSRAMELLITSARPQSLMFGKIIGTGVAGLLQFFIIFGAAFLFYNLNSDVWAGNFFIQRIFNIPLDMFLYVLLFFIIGFFLYAFIYGALGSLASRSEDVATATMPVNFFFIIAFFVVMYGMGAGKLDSPIMVVCSFIPFTSPMAMFTRIAMSNVPPVEIIISVTIAIASTIGIGYLAAAIYRVGVLMYGKPPKLGELIKALKAQRVKS